MKLFNINNIETVKSCQEYFSFKLPSVQLSKSIKKLKFVPVPVKFYKF